MINLNQFPHYLLLLIHIGTFTMNVFGSDDDTLPETCGSDDNFTFPGEGGAHSRLPINRTMPLVPNPVPYLSINEKGQMIAETYPIPGEGSGTNLQCHQTYYFAGRGGGRMSFRSQGYPSHAPVNTASVTCFESPDGWKITLNCEDFSVACAQGHVGISFYGDPHSSKIYCGKGFNSSKETAWSNKLAVIFNTGGGGGNSSESSKRFKCTINVAPPKNEPISTTPPPTPGSCKCGQRNTNLLQSRIVNGTVAKPNEFPWRCFLTDGYNICGCTLISQKWVLTAAHCLHNVKEAFMVLGSSELNMTLIHMPATKSRRIIIHPNFDIRKYGDDIALMELEEPISFTNKISPICLPWNMTNDDFTGCTVVNSGWGYTKLTNYNYPPTSLSKYNMRVVTNKKCNLAYPPGGDVKDDMICGHAPGKTAWKGDSGTSMDLERDGRYYAIGVAVWVDPFIKAPVVFTRVTSYLDWIKSVTGDEKFCGE